MRAAAVRIERGKPAAIEVLEIGVSTGEREIDVVKYSGVARPRLARRAGHQLLGQRRYRQGIGIVEECAMLWTIRVRLRRGLRADLLSLIGILGERLGCEPGARNGSRADQKCAASLIVLGHDVILPRASTSGGAGRGPFRGEVQTHPARQRLASS